MDNPVWAWLARTRISPHQATEAFSEPSVLDAGPGWCFSRYGQTETLLRDGRAVLIAGEHEDFYDPDFYIYNDVVVRDPDGGIEIYGYPEDLFPPTDFHSATLIDEQRIVLVGSLGYAGQRVIGETQVLTLTLDGFVIQREVTSGESPGWIHDHEATLSDDGASILVTRGKVFLGAQASLVENIDDWRFNLADLRWERLTRRRWPRREIARADRRQHGLYNYQSALLSRKRTTESLARAKDHMREMGWNAEPDLDLVRTVFEPPVDHEPEDDSYRVVRIRVEGVVVRYVDTMFSIQMTVEGDLPSAVVDTLAHDLRDKMTALENVAFVITEL